jgi:hypothetical protein
MVDSGVIGDLEDPGGKLEFCQVNLSLYIAAQAPPRLRDSGISASFSHWSVSV